MDKPTLDKIYLSSDVEASGRTPGNYSMLSMAFCVVGAEDKVFYREFKPINDRFILDAMKIGCLGLECLKPLMDQPEYNPRNKHFRPDLVLRLLDEEGTSPEVAMHECADWILDTTRGYKPVEVSKPTKFDGSFTEWYFDKFYPQKSPLGHSALDIGAFYKGLMRDLNANCDVLFEGPLDHNALSDAIKQSKAFGKMQELLLKR